MNNFSNILGRIFIFLIIILIIFFTLSNSYATKNIDKLAYVVALGLDVGNNNDLKLSIQLAKPSTSSSSSSSQSSSVVINSVECSSIEAGINLFNSYISRSINLSHCKVIVISEQLASKDISEYLYDLSNNVEVSSHANIIVTKCEANTFLKMTNPILENFPARYYDIVNTSSKITGYTKSNSLTDFFSEYIDSCQEPTAVLSNINNDNTHSDNTSFSFTNKDSSYIAGQVPIVSTNNIENMGIAVFKGGKLVGELNGIESVCHLIVNGQLKYCNIQIKNPKEDKSDIDLRVQLNGKPNCKLYFINGNPIINIKVNLNTEITSASSGSSGYSSRSQTQKLESQINSYFEEIITNYLYKVSKEYNSDIDGLGKYAIKYFPTKDEWNNYNWLDSFQNSFFNITVNSKIKSSTNFINS